MRDHGVRLHLGGNHFARSHLVDILHRRLPDFGVGDSCVGGSLCFLLFFSLFFLFLFLLVDFVGRRLQFDRRRLDLRASMSFACRISSS